MLKAFPPLLNGEGASLRPSTAATKCRGNRSRRIIQLCGSQLFS